MDKLDTAMIRDMNKRINILENRVAELHSKLYQDKAKEFKDELEIQDEEFDYTNR